MNTDTVSLLTSIVKHWPYSTTLKGGKICRTNDKQKETMNERRQGAICILICSVALISSLRHPLDRLMEHYVRT